MFNMTIGGRGTGKTFGSLRYCIKRFIKKQRGFIYLRRYESDLRKKDRLLTGVSIKFPNYEFRVDGQKLCIRKRCDKTWVIMGYCMALSTAVSDKSIPFDDIDTIIYDEFILSKSMQSYIRNEVEIFIDFYNTVDRMNDRVRVLFLANSVSIVNPYFVYFKITIRKTDKIRTFKNGYVVVEMLRSKEFQDQASNTRFGKMIEDTPYYDYAIGNEFNDDNANFIIQKPKNAEYIAEFRFDGKPLTIYCDYANGFYFVDMKPTNRTDSQIYVLTRDDLMPNMLMLESSDYLLKGLKRMYRLGLVFYANVYARDTFYSIMEYLNIK